ncbi:FG-GAP-like repeat-containing protein [Fuerstiella marisgermanici]|uniref:FG-GAP repeat n=1 Tax=Fuerstiella marisgermanici TaxID=1891926 RepID=A0A1P8WRM7_9PLAN|nr:FG-GAP-like repeat-containing protein [Fuerstiella marisgermanici]APZ96705.1 FG-GAP repeat [Fuerstiella marisgermanici]
MLAEFHQRFSRSIFVIVVACGLAVWLRMPSLTESEPDDRQAAQTADMLRAASVAEDRGDWAGAIESLGKLPADFADRRVYRGWLKKAELQRRTAHLSDARRTLETIVENVDGEVTARRRLAELLAGCGYAFEALTPLRQLLDAGEVDEYDLFRLAVNGHDLYGKQTLERNYALNPQAPMAIAGLLRMAESERDGARIDALLAMPLPDDGILKRIALKRRLNHSLLVDDANELLNVAEQHPESWLIAAGASHQTGDHETALKCAVQAVRLDPWNQPALHRIANLLRGRQPELEDRLQQLATTLGKIERLARQIRQRRREDNSYQTLGTLLFKIGRVREGKGWARVAVQSESELEWAAETLCLNDNQTEFVHPVLAEYGTTLNGNSSTIRLIRPHEESAADEREDAFAFDNVASDVGIGFRYDNGRRPEQQGLFMHQWTGGGVGVVDIDGDTWPDLLFTQGGTLPGDQESQPFGDVIYRNQRGQNFADVTPRAAVDAPGGFGQGTAVGDVNNDGFDDVYIGRVGRNLLLINQGDGTFLPGEQPSTSPAWTTSVAIADHNSDGNPDIYDVNYLSGEDVFTTTCDHAGLQRICGPTDYPAAPDVVAWANGDGTFRSEDSFNTAAPQPGMGLAVGRFVEGTGVQAYIANDEGANQLLSFSTELGVHDSASRAGLAFGQDGTALGSMGIAIADVAGDGTADLFVTNYYSEPNNLYAQIQPTVFMDATSYSGLSAAGYSMLGFGCQFADFDADGDQDLIVSNGHLDDFTHLNRPYRMAAQLFANRGDGSFRANQPTGNYFDKDWLGRAVALLDWNGDGRTDFAVTHLDDGVGLVENLSPQAADSLAIGARGTRVARDAVGAILQLNLAPTLQTQWITAGDGYQCSNQKVGRFANLQGANRGELSIQWPGNSEPPIRVPIANAGLQMVIEGRELSYSVPR